MCSGHNIWCKKEEAGVEIRWYESFQKDTYKRMIGLVCWSCSLAPVKFNCDNPPKIIKDRWGMEQVILDGCYSVHPYNVGDFIRHLLEHESNGDKINPLLYKTLEMHTISQMSKTASGKRFDQIQKLKKHVEAKTFETIQESSAEKYPFDICGKSDDEVRFVFATIHKKSQVER